MDKKLEELRRLTDLIKRRPEDPDIVWPLADNKQVQGFRLWRENDVAVIRAKLDAGSVFPRHINDQDEIVVVYRGRLGYRTFPPGKPIKEMLENSLEGVLNPGESYRFPAGLPHSVMPVGGDCWLIVTTVPATEAF